MSVRPDPDMVQCYNDCELQTSTEAGWVVPSYEPDGFPGLPCCINILYL